MITQNDKQVNKQLKLLEEIFATIRTNAITFSKTEATKIIGSRHYLEKLIAIGKIRMTKRTNRQFEQCKCNAEDVLRYVNYKHKQTT